MKFRLFYQFKSDVHEGKEEDAGVFEEDALFAAARQYLAVPHVESVRIVKE